MLARIIPYLFFVHLIVCACYFDKSVNSKSDENALNNPEGTLKIWLLSDIQPKNQVHKQQFQKAINDINKNVPYIDFAIVAGDIVDRANEADFDWYLSMKPSSYIKEWYEIAGNHDEHQWGRVSTFNFHFLLMSNVDGLLPKSSYKKF